MDNSKIDMVDEYHVVEHGINTSDTLRNSHKRNSFSKLFDRLTNKSNTDIEKMSSIPEEKNEDNGESLDGNMIKSINFDDEHFTDKENNIGKDDILGNNDDILEDDMDQLLSREDSFANMTSTDNSNIKVVDESKTEQNKINIPVDEIFKTINTTQTSPDDLNNNDQDKLKIIKNIYNPDNNNLFKYVIPVIAIGVYAMSYSIKKHP